MKHAQHTNTNEPKEGSPLLSGTREAVLPIKTDATAVERVDPLDMILADLKRPAAELNRSELAKIPNRFKWALR